MEISLNAETAVEYVKHKPELIDGVLGGAQDLASTALSEGNINVIYRVSSSGNPDRSVIIKQALSYAWRYPDFKMPLDRSRIEAEILSLEAKYAPEQTPRLYLHDSDAHINVIEDLNHHLVMRDGLMQRKRYPLVAQHVGLFAARNLFFTSDLYLSSADKKAMVPLFINPVLCKVQEDLVFTQPYMENPNNRWTHGMEPQVEEIHSDDALRAEIFYFKELYMTHAQALLHNDLHTGSIMLNETESKVIDPEFGFFGPMAHDLGTYFANLALGYAAQEYHSPDPQERAAYRSWIMGSFCDTWHIFETEFMNLWENAGNGEWQSPGFRRDYVRRLLQETAGFGAAEMFRRLVGMAQVSDFWNIKDEHVRAVAESLGVNIAYSWIRNWRGVKSIDDLADMVTGAKATIS